MAHPTKLLGAPAGGASALLTYHRFHRYQLGEKGHIDRSEGSAFLFKVADACAGQQMHASYQRYHERFKGGIDALGSSRVVQVRTDWRTVVGWGTNPALESGISLHPIHGFPYVPGSAVKGVVRAQAESDLLVGEDAVPIAPRVLPPALPPALVASLARAMRVREWFGSLAAENHPKFARVPTAKERFSAWLTLLQAEASVPDVWRPMERALKVLVADTGTGGQLVFFEAVPDKDVFNNRSKPLEVDVLTVHHREYYRGERQYPSDDEDPLPVYFLALKAGQKLEFRFRLADRGPEAASEADCPTEVIEQGEGLQSEEVLDVVEGWLLQALAERGLGAKTAAGYGYGLACGDARHEADEQQTQRAAPTTVDLKKLDVQIDKAIKDGSHEAGARLAKAIWATPAAVAKIDDWRKRLKPTFKDRVAWFDRYPAPTPAGTEALPDVPAAGRHRMTVLRVRRIAPSMIGGARRKDANAKAGCEKNPTLRPPSIRGQLRFWTRALAGDACRERESALWGDTTLGQRVSLISASPVTQKAKLYPTRFSTPLEMLPPGAAHSLKFRLGDQVQSDPEELERLCAVMWVWLHLGALGGRARRGYGALQWLPRADDLLSDWSVPDGAFGSRDALVDYLTLGLTRALAAFGVDAAAASAPRQASEFFRLRSLDQVFVGQPFGFGFKDDVDASDEEIVAQNVVKGVRHDPEDPYNGRSHESDEARQMGYINGGGEEGRLASPMMWRLIQLTDERFVPVMTWSPHAGPGDRAVTSLSRGTPMHEHLVREPTARENPGLGLAESLAGNALA